jgi:MFS family permease
MLLATWAWLFGSIWFNTTSGTPTTNFAKGLGASRFQFGLMTAIPFIASLLSLPASVLIEATGKRKLIFLIALYFQRVMWIPIALLPLWLMRQHGTGPSSLTIWVFLILLFLMHTGQAVGGPAWVSWMADLVPDRVRGKYFSRRRALGVFTAVPAAYIVGVALDWQLAFGPDAILKTCAIVFLVAAVCGFMDIQFFAHIPDIPTPPRKGLHLLRAMRRPLHNREYLWFVGFVATLWFSISFMAQFITLYVMETLTKEGRGGVNVTTQMMVIVAPNVAMLLVLSAWGRAVDRMGKKPVLTLASIGLIPIGIAWCFISGGNVWMGYLLSGLGQMLWCGVEVANLNLMMEFSGSDDENGNGGAGGGTAYAAVNTVIYNVAGCLGGLAAGLIAQALRNWEWQTSLKTFTLFDVLFALSAAARLIAVLVFLPHIHEHGARPAAEALRFMTTNIYNNLFNTIQYPLRLLRPRKAD